MAGGPIGIGRLEGERVRVGVDIVSVERIKEVVERWGERFLTRAFSPEELAIARERRSGSLYQYLAGRFAVKEAIIKTLDSPVSLREISVVREESGRPVVVFPEGNFEVSISHTRDYAVAVCVRM